MITLTQLYELYEINKNDYVDIETNCGKKYNKVMVVCTMKDDGIFKVEDRRGIIITIKGYKKINLHRS